MTKLPPRLLAAFLLCCLVWLTACSSAANQPAPTATPNRTPVAVVNPPTTAPPAAAPKTEPTATPAQSAKAQPTVQPTEGPRPTGTPRPTEAPPPTPGPPPLPPKKPAKMNTPEYGVQAFLWWRPELAERDLLKVKEMGFTWVKQVFGWRDIELEKGKFDWEHTDHIVYTANRYGDIDLLIRIDFQPNWARSGCSYMGPPTNMKDYGDFLTAVATRYKGRIRAYQIWNEPNLAREWCDQKPNPAEYANMLKTAYTAIKAVRRWIKQHNHSVKAEGRGVRIVACYLPSKSPWLNAIEPKWVHGKRAVVEPTRLLSAQELADRVCAYYGCTHEPHLAISEKVP